MQSERCGNALRKIDQHLQDVEILALARPSGEYRLLPHHALDHGNPTAVSPSAKAAARNPGGLTHVQAVDVAFVDFRAHAQLRIIGEQQRRLGIRAPGSLALATENFQNRAIERRQQHRVGQLAPRGGEARLGQADLGGGNRAIDGSHELAQVGELRSSLASRFLRLSGFGPGLVIFGLRCRAGLVQPLNTRKMDLGMPRSLGEHGNSMFGGRD